MHKFFFILIITLTLSACSQEASLLSIIEKHQQLLLSQTPEEAIKLWRPNKAKTFTNKNFKMLTFLYSGLIIDKKSVTKSCSKTTCQLSAKAIKAGIALNVVYHFTKNDNKYYIKSIEVKGT